MNLCAFIKVSYDLRRMHLEFAKLTKHKVTHKGLKSPKRFTNLPLGSMSSILNLMGLMHSYRSPGVPRTPKSYNALIEVFKFI